MEKEIISFLIVVIALFVVIGVISATVIIRKLEVIHVLVNSRLSSALKEITLLKRTVIVLAKKQGIEDPILEEIINQTSAMDSETERKMDASAEA